MRIYLDSNVFISALEGIPPDGDGSRRLLALGDSISNLFVTSELSLAETLVKPFELMLEMKELPTNPRHLAPGTLAADYSDLLATRHGMGVQPIERSTRACRTIRAEDKAIRLPDAIHVATAEQSDCTHFLTSDKDLLKRVRRISPVEFEPQALQSLIDEIGHSA